MTARGVDRLARVAVGLVLLVLFFEVAKLRRAFVLAVTRNPGTAGAELRLPPGHGAGLAPAERVRVVLVDGAGLSTAQTMPTWAALCARGLDLVVDTGFPTVSLPVQVALWSGRSQQATGVLFSSTGKPLPQPLAARGLPGRVPGSIAIAESAPYIVHSLGFAEVHPPTADKKLPEGWARRWLGEAVTAFAGPGQLAFTHILKVDTAGHRTGRASPEWRAAAALADLELASLVAAAPDARWFVLADHDHLAGGGHGGEELALRRVRACVAGPGLAPARGATPIHITDLSRALADSLGLAPDPASPGRPLAAALSAPFAADDVLPRPPTTRVATALALVGLALLAAASFARRRPWLLPWWFPVALLALVVQAHVPSLSTPMIYPPKGKLMVEAFAPGLAVLAVTLAIGARDRWGRALAAQLVLPALATLAVAVVTGALPLLVGDAVCPIVPRWTGWLSPLMLMTATAAGVAGLVVLASAALPRSDRATPPGTRRSGPAAP